MGDGGVGDGIDHLGAVLDDPALLVVPPHHVTGGVVDEDDRGVVAVAQLDELGRLVGLLGEDHPLLIGHHPHREPVDRPPSGDHRGAVERLVLLEPRAVEHPGQHLAHVEGDPEVARDDAQQVLGVVDRLVAGHGRPRSQLAPVEVDDDLTADPDGVLLVDGEVVRQTRGARVHLGAPQFLIGGLFAGGHLDQRRPTEEHLGTLLDHHRVVAHRRHIRSAGGGVAEDDGEGGDALLRQLGEIAEPLAAGDEDLGLIGQVGAARFDQVDQGEAVLHRNVLGAQRLRQRVAVRRPCLAGRIVGGDDALDAGDDPDPGDHVGAQRLVRAPCRQSGQLEEGRVPIEQEFDPLPGQQLAPGTVTGHVLLAPAGARLRQQLLELLEPLHHRLAVGPELLVGGVDPAGEHLHGRRGYARRDSHGQPATAHWTARSERAAIRPR